MPVFDLGSPIAIVALALIAAAAWGTSDFGGGFLGRRAPVLGVLVTTQAIGFVLALALMAVRGEPWLEGRDLPLSLAAGLLAALGMACLYGGLAVGRMGIVAPVAAVLTALVPAAIGIALDGAPSPVVIIGMGIAIVAVVVVSASPHAASDAPSGLPLAIIAGISLGLLGFVLTRVSHDYLLAPLAVIRGVQVAVVLVVIVVGRRAWRLPRGAWPLAIVVGCFDLFGNVAFLAAARGALATAAVVSSLYPVVTVLLAATILRERLTASHAAGVALAGVAIAMIAGGSAG